MCDSHEKQECFYSILRADHAARAHPPLNIICVNWIGQLDDMRADSPHPIILAPKESGFNSHLTKVHENGLSAAPAMRVSYTSLKLSSHRFGGGIARGKDGDNRRSLIPSW